MGDKRSEESQELKVDSEECRSQLLTFGINSTSSQDSKGIFEILWRYNIIRASVILVNDDYPKIYTSNPYHDGNECGKICRVKSITKCSSESINFQEGKSNFTNCCAIYNNPHDNQDHYEYRMISKMLPEISNHLKLKIIRSSTNLSRCPMVFSVEGSYGFPKQKPIFTLGNGWFSFVYKIPPMKLLKYIINWRLTTFTGTIFTVALVAWIFITKFVTKTYDVSSAAMDVWALTILGCIPKFPKLKYLKILVSLYLWFVIIIHTISKTNLALIFTVDQLDGEINDNFDIINSDRPLCIFDIYYESYFKENYTDTWYTKIKDQLIVFSHLDGWWSNRSCIYFYGYERIESLRYKSNLNISYFMDNSLSRNSKFVLKINEGYHFKAVFDDFITSFIENGVLQHLMESMRKEMHGNKYKIKEDSVEPRVLTFDYVYGLFVFCALIYILSIVVFVIEIVYNKYWKK
ncbi:hypothetical protein FQA39_LY16755 [Lamprigera yunnana]|nr:hypothetical protein FQA39_LY16755 [Lamprigera yunnana]